VLGNKYILGTWLNVWDFWAYSCNARPVTVYRVTQPWSGSTTKWWPGPSYDAASPLWTSSFAYGYYSCPSGGWATFPIPADRVTRWTHGTEPFYGFTLRASETDSYGWKRFASSGYITTNDRPYIDVNYADQGAAYSLPNPQFNPAVTATQAGGLTVRVTNWGSATWTPTNGYKLTYAVLNSSGAVVFNGARYAVTQNAGPGQSVDVPVQVGPITNGPGTYTLRLDMVDPAGTSFNAGYGVPFGTVPFTVANGPPQPAAIYPPNNGYVPYIRPALWAQYFDPDNSPGTHQYSYQVCGGTPAAPVNCRSSGWITSAAWTPLPEGAVEYGVPSFWYVSLSDGSASAQYGPYWFTALAPQPEITSHLAGAPDNPDTPGLNPQVGNYTTTVTDASVPVAGPALAITRTYNSQDPRNSAFGIGWSSPIDQSLTMDDDTADAVIRTASGQDIRFGRGPDIWRYTAPPGVNMTLRFVQPPGDWVLRDASGRRTYFSFSDGSVEAVTDADGRRQIFTYDGGHLNQIVDVASGRSLHLTWSGGHVVSVSADPAKAGQAASTWTYTYNGNQLVKVCTPLSATSCVSYTYTGSSFYQSTVRDDNPTAYWTLGEASGSAAANLVARAPGDLDGQYRAGVTLAQAGALANSPDTAAGFPGSTTSAVALPDNLLNSSMAFAVEMWFKTAAGGHGTLFGQQNTDLSTLPGNHVPMLYVGTDGKLRGHAWVNNIAPITSSGRVDDGAWHHVVLSVNVDTQSLYLDGSFVGSLGGVVDHLNMTKYFLGNGTGHPVWPATTSSKALFPFTGQIDEAAVYRHALSQAQVYAHYLARTGSSRLATVVEPGNFTAATIGYDTATGRVTSLTDRNGATWTLPAPTTSSGTRTAVLSSTVASSIVYNYDLDHNGRLVSRVDGTGTTKWDYNDAGFVSKLTDANNNAITYQTDARGNVLARTTCRTTSSCQTSYAGYFLNPDNPLDARNDQRIWTADARSASSTDTTYRTTYTLDANGRVVQTTYPKPAGQTVAPSTSDSYSSAPTYAVSTQARAFTPADATVLPLTGDDANTLIDLPFTLMYYGNQVHYMWVSTNGYLAFDEPWQPTFDEAPIPSPNDYNNAIYPFGSDLVADASSSIRTSTTGTAPNRQFTVEWRNVMVKVGTGTSARFSAEVVIGEDGKILFDYSGLTDAYTHGSLATVGLENVDATAAVQYSYHQTTLNSGTAVVFTPNYTPGYTVRNEAKTFTDLVNVQPLTGDEAVWDTALSFPVTFYGQTYNHIWVSTNGFASFVDPGGAHGTGRTGLPNAAAPAAAVFPFWDDLVADAESNVRLDNRGTYPNREIAIEWYRLSLKRDTNKRVSFEVVFGEPGQVTFHYWRLDNADEQGNQATVGIQDATRTRGVQYSYQTASLYNGASVTFLPNGSDAAGKPGGLLLSETAANGAVTQYTCNTSGDRLTMLDPVGLKTTYGYDHLGRPVSTNLSSDVGGQHVDYGTTTTAFNNVSLPNTVTAAAVTNPITGVSHTAVTTYTYDDGARLTKQVVSDSTGADVARTTQWGYDPAGRLTSITTPDNAVTTQTWDAEGNVASVTRASGLVLTYQYNDRHQLLETDATGANVDPMDPSATLLVLDSRTYDPAGRPASLVDAMGRETDYTYFGDNLPATEVRVQRDANGNVTASTTLSSYAFDAAGYQSSETLAGGATTTYTRDPAGYLTGETLDPSGLARHMAYARNPDGSLASGTLTGPESPGRSETASYTYDAVGRLLTETVANPGGTPASLTTTTVRDPRGLPTRVTDPAGTATSYTYDAHQQLATVTGAARDTWVNGVLTTGVAPVTTLGRDTFDEVTDQRDPSGALVHGTFDPMGRSTSVTLPGYTPPGGTAITATTQRQYDSQGYLIQTTDPLNRVTTYTRDRYGTVLTRTDPDPDGAGPKPAPVWTYGYDRDGELLSTADPTGGQTSATYDVFGRQATSSVSDRDTGQTVWFTTTFGYDDAGNLTRTTSALNHTGTATYNAAGELTRTTDPTNRFMQYSHDMAGRVTGTAMGQGSAFANPVGVDTFDLAGRRTAHSDCTTNTSGGCATVLRTQTWAYDGAGRVTQSTTGAGRTVANAYDGAGQLTSVSQRTDPADPATAVTVQFGYDSLGHRTRLVDGNGNATTYTFNVWGLPESTIEPATLANPGAADRTWTTAYDAAGQSTVDTLPGGVTRTRGYDADGRLTDETGTGAAATTAARHVDHDAVGRLTKVSGPAGDTTYTYNDRGLLTHTSGPGITVSATYDAEDHLISRTDPTGTGVFTYDAAGRLATVADPLTGKTATYGYTPFGEPASVTYGTGQPSRTYTYDNLNRLATDTWAAPGGTTLASTTYTYDNDNLLSTKNTSGYAGAGANTYGYDGLGRLTSWTRPDAVQIGYGYDPASNRTSVTGPAGTRTTAFDERNRQTTATGGGQPDQSWTWTPRGTLASTTIGSATNTQTSDAFERTVAATTSGHSNVYAYDGLDRLAQYNGFNLRYDDSTDNPVQNPASGADDLVFRDPQGRPVSDRPTGGAARVLLVDPVHTDVNAAADPSTGTLGASTSYDPYGQPAASTGSIPLGYQGGWTDPDSGQVNAAARWYDPGTGAFTSRDTLTVNASSTAQPNRYAYAVASPVNYTDPNGHLCTGSVGIDFLGCVFTTNPFAEETAGAAAADIAIDVGISGLTLSGLGLSLLLVMSLGGDEPRGPVTKYYGKRVNQGAGAGRPYSGWNPDPGGFAPSPGFDPGSGGGGAGGGSGSGTGTGTATGSGGRGGAPRVPPPPPPCVTIGLSLGLGGGQLCRTPWLLGTKPRPAHDGQTTRSPIEGLLAAGQQIVNTITTVVDPIVGSDPDGATAPSARPEQTTTQVNRDDCLSGGPTSQPEIEYSPLDHSIADPRGRATGAMACYPGKLPPVGPRLKLYTPAGYQKNKGMARGHLIAHMLGGSDKDPRNFVPIYQVRVNVQLMLYRVEWPVRRRVESGETVFYSVTPEYHGNDPVPYELDIEIDGSTGGSTHCMIENDPNGTSTC
jgi:RHS repeat-associated protein